MNGPRPLEITTPAHAMAPWIYGLQIAQGVGYIIGLTTVESLSSLLPAAGVSLWAIIVVVGGLLAFISVRMARHPAYTLPALKVEMWAALGIAFSDVWYIIALFAGKDGIFEVYITKTYVLAICGACIHRAFQIRRERRRVIEQLRNRPKIVGVVADEEGK